MTTAEWKSRLEKLSNDLVVAEERVTYHNSRTAELIVGECDEHEIQRSKADAVAAKVDIDHLVNAVANAESQLKEAVKYEEKVFRAKQHTRIKKLQQKRAKELQTANDFYVAYLSSLKTSEELALQIHSESGGVRPVLESLQSRHGPIVEWTIAQFLEAMPFTAMQLGRATADNQQARQHMEGKTLADLQPDFAALFKTFQETRVA